MQTSSGRNPNWDFYSVTPGYTATGLNDFKGLKSAQEGAKPIVRLVTSNSEYITGKFLREEGTVPW